MIASLPGPRELRAIAYAIMIHEDFNRPPIVRGVERLLGPKLVHTFGLMQVSSSRPLDDRESVRLGLQRLEESFAGLPDKVRNENWHYWSQRVLAEFNRDDQYISQVQGITRDLLRRVLPPRTVLSDTSESCLATLPVFSPRPCRTK